MKRLFKVTFFACGFIGLLLNLVYILVSFSHEAELGSALERLKRCVADAA